MTSAEVQSRQCAKALKNSLERKQAHPQSFLSQKMVTDFGKKKKNPRQMGRVHK